ncbi:MULTISPECIES: hypothetical protein [unclassified Dysgonomonas]|uniref:hypothetical protein n=1 Tax=unclassified Dysgonomonas TaxID=2630389 RepID=UPI0013D343EB|nr:MULTISPECIES: hypothetical protein [unclassified Dysgonomonas]
MHFESSNLYRNYEIEIVKVFVEFEGDLKKAQDFQRRLNYKYDWIQVEICNNGKITNIGNLEDIRSNWLLLRQKLQDDYAGASVKDCLDKLSNQFLDDDYFNNLFIRYYEYGLLFPTIPEKHTDTWQDKRIIYLDTFTESQMIETTTFFSENDEFKTYNLNITKEANNNHINLISANGQLERIKKDNLIQKCDVKVKYFYDESIINEWNFGLERIVEPNNN